jgi:hypothetical protein
LVALSACGGDGVTHAAADHEHSGDMHDVLGGHVEPHVQGECDEAQGHTCADSIAEIAPGSMASDAADPQALQFRLESAVPAGLAKGYNQMRVSVLDMVGNGFEPETLTAVGWMPDHGHGTTTPPRLTRDDSGDEWLVEDLDLFMGGYWRIYFFVCDEPVEACCDGSVVPCGQTSASLRDTLFFETWIRD